MIESTSTDATGIHFAHWLGWFPSSPFLHKIVCLQHSSAVGQLNTQGKSGSGASPLPTSTIFQQTSKHIYITIYIHTHTQARTRTHIHTNRTERKGGIAGKGDSHNPAVRPRGLARQAVFHAPASKVHGSLLLLPASAHRECACLCGEESTRLLPAASRLEL